MILAALRDDAYNVVLLLHILAVMIGFAPALINPFVNASLREDPSARQSFFQRAAKNGHRVFLPAITLSGLLGIALVIMSGDVWEFSQAWVSASFLGWIVIMGLMAGLIIPAQKALSQGDLSKEGNAAVGERVVVVLLVIMLYLMVFTPGA